MLISRLTLEKDEEELFKAHYPDICNRTYTLKNQQLIMPEYFQTIAQCSL